MNQPEQRVLITGADKGLGRALVERFLQEGWQVFAGAYQASTDFSDLQAQYPARLHIIALDVSSHQSIKAAAERFAQLAPALDMLINNAGIHLEPEETPLEELNFDDGHLERSMAVNAFGALRAVQLFLPVMERGSFKRVVNISSEAGSIGNLWRDREFAYCMSKAALNMSTHLLQRYLSPRGFRVLALHPGWMRTDMGGQAADIDAAQAALDVFHLSVRSWQPDDPIYLDHQGNPLRW